MTRIVILGGSGFLGTSLCEQLARHTQLHSANVVVPSRRRDKARHLLTLPNVHVVESSVHNEQALRQVLKGADVLINLIAILHGSASEFERVHVDLPRRLVDACRQEGVRRVIHVSALGVPPDLAEAPSNYLRSKTQGEQVWRNSGLDVTLLRPSVIFGQRDKFINLFAQLQSVMPVVALAGAEARFQPVWVEDVAKAIVRCLEDGRTVGQTYECAGPDVFSLADIVKAAGRWSGHDRPVVPVPWMVGRMQAALLSWLPGEPLMSQDNLDSMKVPNIASGDCPGLGALGIQPASMGSICPAYLRKSGGWDAWLDEWRASARRS